MTMTSPSRFNSSVSVATLVVAVIGTVAASYAYHRIAIRRESRRYQSLRGAERKGRIRAEVKLRQALRQNLNDTGAETTNGSNDFENSMTLKRIGTVVSPFTKRVGTPRQGALVPSSRGYIEFTVAPQALEGLAEYTHLWVIFGFHANTNVPGSLKSKIKPPRAPYKVGHLSTRSPHRPNPIGLSLVKIECIEKRRLYISAFDLVHGTPVYDIKPCVPWDCPEKLRVPEWVSRKDSLPRVELDMELLQPHMKELAPVYARTEVKLAQSAIKEILAQDPRCDRKRGTSTDKPFSIVVGSLQIEFLVDNEGVVRVIKMNPIQFPDSAYVEGIPLSSELIDEAKET